MTASPVDEHAVDEAADENAEAQAAPEPPTAYGVLVSESHGQQVLHPSREELIATVKAMADDGYVSIIDLFGVDYLTHEGRRSLPAGIAAERFELVVILISHATASRARLRVQVSGDDPVVPTLFDVFPGTEAMEREAFDMFGIVFEGHPMLTRILMPEDWEGHPLRKDFSVGSVPVQFKLKGAKHGDPGTR